MFRGNITHISDVSWQYSAYIQCFILYRLCFLGKHLKRSLIEAKLDVLTARPNQTTVWTATITLF